MFLLDFFYKHKEPKSLGEMGEDLAVKYLRKKDYKIMGRNFKNPSGRQLGEIDIIASKDKKVVFVEVKTRTNNNPLPEQSITREKLHRLNKIASRYLSTHNLEDSDYQFDAISIVLADNGQKEIRHLECIFY